MKYINRGRKKITVASTISGSGLVKAGGSNVVHGLYTCLAEFFDVEIVYIAPGNEKYRKYEIVDGLTEIVIPKTLSHVIAENELKQKLNAATAYDIGLMYYLNQTPQFHAVLRKSVEDSDIVFIERPYLFDDVKRCLNGRPLFQRSQNIEYYFRMSNIPKSNERDEVLTDLYNLEQRCCLCSDVNFACSDVDLGIMHSMYGIDNKQLCLLPNGVDIRENPFVSVEERLRNKKRYGLSKEKLALFIGGGHTPNMEACEMIYKIAPYCPDVKFFFAGNLCNTLLKKKRPENVALLGLISEDMRRFLFSVFDMGLNPMYSGSGSNIKMFDYMSMGLPIVTSRFGARGIDDISMFHIADTEEELINTITKFCITDEVDAVQQARNEIEKIYDWRVIAQGVRDKILEYV